MVPTSIIRPDIRSFSLHYKYEVLLNHRLTCLCLFSNVCLQKLLLLISGVVWLVVNVLMVWDGVVWRTPTGVSTHFKLNIYLAEWVSASVSASMFLVSKTLPLWPRLSLQAARSAPALPVWWWWWCIRSSSNKNPVVSGSLGYQRRVRGQNLKEIGNRPIDPTWERINEIVKRSSWSN